MIVLLRYFDRGGISLSKKVETPSCEVSKSDLGSDIGSIIHLLYELSFLIYKMWIRISTSQRGRMIHLVKNLTQVLKKFSTSLIASVNEVGPGFLSPQ